MKRFLFLFLSILIFNSQTLHAEVPEDVVPYSEPEEEFEATTISEQLYYHLENSDTINRDNALFDALRNPGTHIDRDSTKVWWKLALKNRLDLNDTTIHYPKFIKFCLDVYKWADKAFNSYDPEYVVGTGRRWKARLINDNWVDSYAMDFDHEMPVRMLSNLTSNIGGYIQYMAVSVGYSVDIQNLIGKGEPQNKKMEFGFSCARFNAEIYYQSNKGGSYIRRFGNYNTDKLFMKEYFPGLTLEKYGLNAYYFFNNKKYSYGAAYSFAKYQLKSAGSAMIGFNYNNLDINIDFSKLNPTLKEYLTISPIDYHFHYNTYSIIAGYGFNWVLNRHLLFNISAIPGIGLTKCYEDSLEANGSLMALTILGKSSLTYNLKDFFFCLTGKIDGNWYRSNKYSLFNSVETFTANVGFRF